MMNSATITLENVSDEFLKVFKELAKVANAKFKVDKSKKTKAPKNLKEIPNKETLKAIKECESGKNGKSYEKFSDFWDEMKREIDDEVKAQSRK